MDRGINRLEEGGNMVERLKLNRSNQLYEEAKILVPGGVAGIRRPYNFVPGEYPIFFDHGQGGRVVDVDGNEYIDFLCAYGPIILGYREQEVDEAVIAQIREKGFCFSLTQPVQNALAAKLRQLIPSAEMTALVKTGSDATTAAIRVARGYTGKLKVARCGYHGWHDWCVEAKGGIPQKLYEDVHEFEYNDLDQLEDLLRKYIGDVAAIIVTPIGHPLSQPVQMPKPGFLEGVRRLADEYSVVLVFDEIRSGFRVDLGGAQKLFGVTPDLTCIGKAMANGYPISAVVGVKRVMQVLEDKVFLSSTFFPNSDAQVAALKTIEILERDHVLDRIREKGTRFGDRVAQVVKASGLPVTFSGTPWMPYITFDPDPEKRYKVLRLEFYTQLIRRGVFLQPFHHGYICYRHSDEDLDRSVHAIQESLAELKKIA
jgi:glutamate-1-semialdehyde aminotransferase